MTWGLGRHAYYLTPTDKIHASRFSDVGQAFCIFSLSFCKLAVAAAFSRLVEGTGRKWAQIYLWFSAGLAFLVNFLAVVFLFAQCSPLAKNFNTKLAGHCWNPQIFDRMVLAQGSACSPFPPLSLGKH